MIARPGRCVVMGILNVTPDSFSDGGRHSTVEAAVAHGLHMAGAGADYVDVGGESTRPGAGRVPPEEECRRVLPVVAGLAGLGIAVSIDTTRASVAAASLAAGAVMVNDVSAGLADPAMASVVADAGVPWVLMHRRGESRDMYAGATYGDVVADVRRELCRRVDAAMAAGVAAERLVVDPGLGFAKQPEHDLALLAGLDRITDLGFPVLVGASRKRFLGAVLASADGRPWPPDRRDSATVATSVLAARAGAWGVRVHDVAGSADAVRVLAAVDTARRHPDHRPDTTDNGHTERWRSA
ncbi:dihydropteroate synthase [Geodermatophilus amargosae]|uniref:Dihydropteroate synthase n=1 Tax=Geodermatophilus amargosae TaxID=1296565 RepID=A0A1I6Z4D2_9ACTN|nr:dihydropteroate synthase [Geodermatophilus amargosae]SFT57570.1 dihydropteroate synthase [Geodermatophilus amargosae]